MNSKYRYKGIPLNIYCKNHDLNIDTQRARIAKKKKQFPDLDEQTIVNMVISTCGTNIKYIYKDQLLSEWCRQNEEDYTKMVSRVDALKKQYPKTSDKELVRMAIEDYGDRGIKYFYDDIPLVDYCKDHPEVNISSVITHIRRQLHKNPSLDPNVLIKNYINSEHKKHYSHFVGDIPLKEYCEQNEIIYQTILTNLSEYRNDPKYKHLTEEERLKIILRKYKKFEVKFMYEGVSLKKYCHEHNYSYSSIYRITTEKMLEDQTLSTNDAIKWALENVKKYGILYYYDDVPLVEYCQDNDLNVKSIRSNIKYALDNNLQNKPINEIVAISVKKYESRRLKDKIDTNILSLKDTLNKAQLEQIFEFLEISNDNVNELISLGFTYYQSATLIYFFADIEKIGERKALSLLKLRDIFELVEKLESLDVTDEEEILKIDLYLLYAIYKCDLYDTRYLLYIHQKRMIKSKIYQAFALYNLSYDKYLIEEFESEVKVRYFEILQARNINLPGAFVNYTNNFVAGTCKNLAFQVVRNQLVVSLNEEIKSNKGGSTKSRIELIKDEKIDYNHFGDGILDMLSILPPEELNFIIKRYQDNYTLEELSRVYKMPIFDLEQKEIEILAKLRENPEIKSLLIK